MFLVLRMTPTEDEVKDEKQRCPSFRTYPLISGFFFFLRNDESWSISGKFLENTHSPLLTRVTASHYVMHRSCSSYPDPFHHLFPISPQHLPLRPAALTIAFQTAPHVPSPERLWRHATAVGFSHTFLSSTFVTDSSWLFLCPFHTHNCPSIQAHKRSHSKKCQSASTRVQQPHR